MIYLKSVLFGMMAAVAACALWILALLLPILVPLVLSRGGGAGGGGAVLVGVSSGSIAAAAVIGFAAGFCWKFARTRARNRAR